MYSINLQLSTSAGNTTGNIGHPSTVTPDHIYSTGFRTEMTLFAVPVFSLHRGLCSHTYKNVYTI